MPDDNVYAWNILCSSRLFSIPTYNGFTEDYKQDTTNRGAGLCASASSWYSCVDTHTHTHTHKQTDRQTHFTEVFVQHTVSLNLYQPTDT